MKNLNRLFFALLLMVFSANYAVAQSDAANVTITADVLAQFTVTTQVNLDYANIATDISTLQPYVDPTDDANDANINGTPAVGRVLVDAGSSGATVNISWNTDATLAGPGTTGLELISYSPELWGLAAESVSARAPAASATQLTTSTGTSATLDTNGDFTIWTGGTLSHGDASLAAGAYSTTNDNGTVFTVTVSYL